MFSEFFITVAACNLLALSASAHMVITSPVPYGEATLNNSPLEDDGSDFPCKQRAGVYDIGTMNKMPVGVPQKLAFKGGATHGGGSCQISVTLDKEPTTNSEWKVIHSILGGCPNSFPGNANGSPTYDGNPTFEFSMPQGMPNGQYTLAWTWFNKIGNREMYMNCAPIEVTGGADNNDVYDTLPVMFVINLPREECENTEMQDFVFPSPGKYVETYKNTALGSSTQGPNCAAVTNKGAGAGEAGSAAQSTGYAGSSATAPAPSSDFGSSPSYSAPYVVQTKAPVSIPQLQNTSVASANNVLTLTSMLTVTATTRAPSASQAPPDQASSVSGGSTYGGSSSNGTGPTGSCTGGAVACETNGSIICIGSDQWGMCNAGCATPMALAAGTSCTGGTISKRHDVH